MLLVVAVVVGGILLGLVFGGSFRNLGEVHLRWWPLALTGLILQLIPVPSRPGQADHWAAVGLFAVSYVVLLVFVAANIRVPGFPLIAVGFLLNVLVIGLNGGMPVRDDALRRAAGSDYARAHARLLERGGLRHHLARPDDVFVPLSDVVGIGAPIANVYSPGDLPTWELPGPSKSSPAARWGSAVRGDARVVLGPNGSTVPIRLFRIGVRFPQRGHLLT